MATVVYCRHNSSKHFSFKINVLVNLFTIAACLEFHCFSLFQCLVIMIDGYCTAFFRRFESFFDRIVFHQNHNTHFDWSWRALMGTRRPYYASRKTWAVKSNRDEGRIQTLSEWRGGFIHALPACLLSPFFIPIGGGQTTLHYIHH